MRKLLLGLAVGLTVVAAPTGVAAAASPTVRMAIIHVVRGCHVWANASYAPLGATRTVTLKRGATLEIRDNCPMSFDFVQTRGPKLDLGGARTYPGTIRKIAFAKRGVYAFRVTNVQSSEELGLQTMGPDNTLVLTVRVS